jgi:CHAT domain-containing protein
MNSFLLLSVPEEQPSPAESSRDGVLEAWEIASQLKLHADLVVLSACETALGEIIANEGVVGLARAFQLAGARATVATQWPVVDSSTGRLMVAFHQALRRGLPKDYALQEAQIKLLADEAVTHPYYWAAFRLLGDRTAISIPALQSPREK